MIVTTGAALRNEIAPVLAPSPLVYNTAGLAAGAAGGSVLFGLAIVGGLAANTAHALSAR